MTDASIQPAGPRPRRDSVCGARFAYGGVSFEVLCPAGFEPDLGDEHRLFIETSADAPCAATVRVAVTVDAALARETGREIQWRWIEDRAEVRTARVRAQLQRVSPGRYVASARVAPDSSAVSSLTTALTGTIIHREGGIVLHAAGVDIDGRAVLFIGPSGAGKTTASNHTPGARWMARDRAAVFTVGGRWYAWGMAGGDPIELSRSTRPVVPLAGILRVRRQTDRYEIEELDLARALVTLRESSQSWGPLRADEDRLLGAILRVASDLPVGAFYTRLGGSHTEVVRSWIETREQRAT